MRVPNIDVTVFGNKRKNARGDEARNIPRTRKLRRSIRRCRYWRDPLIYVRGLCGSGRVNIGTYPLRQSVRRLPCGEDILVEWKVDDCICIIWRCMRGIRKIGFYLLIKCLATSCKGMKAGSSIVNSFERGLQLNIYSN